MSYIIYLIISFLIFNVINSKTIVPKPPKYTPIYKPPKYTPILIPGHINAPIIHHYTPIPTLNININNIQNINTPNINNIYFTPQPTILNTISTINNNNAINNNAINNDMNNNGYNYINLINMHKINCGYRCIFVDNSHNNNYSITKCTLKSYRYDDRSINGLISTIHKYLNLSNVTFYGYNYKELYIENLNNTEFNQTIFYKCYNCNINNQFSGLSFLITIISIILLFILIISFCNCIDKGLKEQNKKDLYDPIV